jgi:thiopurine S-methyltransferase
METDYWQGRWARGETGWHRPEVNPYLIQHWPAAAVPAGGRVLVPLCGKSLDMRWLAAQGHPVLGVELSPLAAREFFEEAGLADEVETHRVGPFEVSSARGIEIACGDFFDLAALPLTDVAGFYDRASLIALPAQLRVRYAEALGAALPRTARGLAITLHYPQEAKAGPPFSVSPDEIRTLFGARFAVTTLCDDDVLDHNPGFQAAGVPWLRENAFALTGIRSAGE